MRSIRTLVFTAVCLLLAYLGLSDRGRRLVLGSRFREMARLQPLKFLTVAARAKHTATVIFVHGLGDSGHGWESVAEMFARQSSLQHIKWVLPHAPSSPVTANNGMKMPSWFDVFEFGNINAREDEEGMLKSMHAINQLITAEVDAGTPANRIVLGGFSQGGAMTLLTGITNERRLAGLSVMSGWLPIRNTAKTMVSDHAKKLPIFWGHGTADPIVRFEKAQLSLEFLKKNMGLAVVEPDQVLSGGIEFHPYEGLPHSADEQELEDLQTFLKKVIPAQE